MKNSEHNLLSTIVIFAILKPASPGKAADYNEQIAIFVSMQLLLYLESFKENLCC